MYSNALLHTLALRSFIMADFYLRWLLKSVLHSHCNLRFYQSKWKYYISKVRYECCGIIWSVGHVISLSVCSKHNTLPRIFHGCQSLVGRIIWETIFRENFNTKVDSKKVVTKFLAINFPPKRSSTYILSFFYLLDSYKPLLIQTKHITEPPTHRVKGHHIHSYNDDNDYEDDMITKIMKVKAHLQGARGACSPTPNQNPKIQFHNFSSLREVLNLQRQE